MPRAWLWSIDDELLTGLAAASVHTSESGPAQARGSALRLGIRGIATRQLSWLAALPVAACRLPVPQWQLRPFSFVLRGPFCGRCWQTGGYSGETCVRADS
jgi:hypothetical protein